MKKHAINCLALAMCAIALNQKAQGQSQYEIGGQVSSPPLFANYVSLTHPWPVLPFLPYDGVPVYSVLNLTNYYAYDDSGVDDLLASSQTTMEDDSSDDSGGGPLGPLYGTNDFYLSIGLNTNFSFATILAHGTMPGVNYEVFSSTNLFAHFPEFWIPLEIKSGEPNTNVTRFDPFSPADPPVNFFRAETANEEVHLIGDRDAIQTNSFLGNPLQPGLFTFQHDGISSLTVFYKIAGTASNSVDYTDQNGNPLTGVFYFPPDTHTNDLVILPIPGRTYLNPLTIILTIIPTNTYLIAPDAATATITLSEPLFGVAACIDEPIGISYHSPLNSLIVSSLPDGSLNRIFASTTVSNSVTVTNVAVTNWTTISGLQGEVELAIPRRTAFGFTNGDLYFGDNVDPPHVGWVSASGTESNFDWSILINEHTALQGGDTFDLTGTYSNNLIVASGHPPGNEDGSLWMIGSNRQARLLATFPSAQTEGVITITNDVARWGPWAGRILIGDERGIIWAVDTNGTVTSFDLGMNPESLNLISTNENLYACAPDFTCPDGLNPGAVLEMPGWFLAGHDGDLLVTQGGEATDVPAKLFIVHFDAATSSFIVTTIQDTRITHFEHVEFAPLALPVAKLGS